MATQQWQVGTEKGREEGGQQALSIFLGVDTKGNSEKGTNGKDWKKLMGWPVTE